MKNRTRPPLYMLFILLACYASTSINAGFIAGSLVKSIDGFVAIEDVLAHESVESFYHEPFCFNKVTHKHKAFGKKAISIVINNEVIVASLDQKFYMPLANSWKLAKNLKPGDMLLSASGEILAIADIYIIEQETEFFDITVEKSHNFFVSKQEVLVHNAIALPPIVFTLNWAFGAGGVKFVSWGVGAIVCGVAAIFHKKSRGGSASIHVGSNIYAVGGAPDPDDKDREKNNEQPGYGNRVPLDNETILRSKEFQKMNMRVKGAQVYQREGRFYHRDTFHRGKGAHLEVYNKKGIHIGIANPLTGELILDTAIAGRHIF